MSDSSDVQALEKISTEVDDSQIKITLSSHCIKAFRKMTTAKKKRRKKLSSYGLFLNQSQAFLVDKLRKQSERQREICIFISNSNIKLEAEIKQAEEEIKSLLVSYETIRSGNVELKKELLLARENKFEIADRVKSGEKKYEDLWLECKSRYESIPFVQKLLQTSNKAHKLKDDIAILQNEAHELIEEIKAKKHDNLNKDKKRIIDLANFFVDEMPRAILIIQEKSGAIASLKQEIEEILRKKEAMAKNDSNAPTLVVKQRQPSVEQREALLPTDNWPNLCTDANNTLPMPKLKFVNTDFDVLSAKLDEIKIKKVEMLQTIPVKRTDSLVSDENHSASKRAKISNENTGYSFSKPAYIGENDHENNKLDNFSNRKLINILEDIKLEKNDAYNIVSKVNPDKLKGVSSIGREVQRYDEQVTEPMRCDDIEEIDLTNSENIVVPPSPFMDYTQEKIIRTSQEPVDVIVHMSTIDTVASENVVHSFKNSQENIKKKVSFDLPTSAQTDCEDNINDSAEADKTISELDTSAISEEGFRKIKDMVYKKHNLDSSPQFVYAKNNLLQMRNEEKIVTSKFFQESGTLENNKTGIEEKDMQRQETINTNNTEEHDIQTVTQANVHMNDKTAGEEENICSSQKNKESAIIPEKPVSGFLFSHNTQGIPDSLNVSISTTGFEEEADFPHCIDSSLLLSPKADLQMPVSGDNAEVLSQEVPNFLTGLRKTGLSFFGLTSSNTGSQHKAEDQATSNNFNFNFGGEEKKNRGGLFSMFR